MTDFLSHPQTERSGLEIAVVAVAGAFPGAADVEDFWENLISGVESLTFLNDEQLRAAGVSDDQLHHPDFVNAAGGLLADKDTFDAALLGFTPLEAQVMDPQLRKLLECAWTALETAGVDPGAYDGLIGLYSGASANFNWQALTHLSGVRQELGEFAASQLTGREFMATQVSFRLGLNGPALTVATACSTSLVAVHAACQALLNGECHMALAGGVSIQSLPPAGYVFQQGTINSNDGHCRAFSADASGTVSGEGVGVAVLKPLEEAEADGDTILAVVKGTAVNNDGGRKGAYAAPSIDGQAEVIRAALTVAGVEAASIGYVEAHGTGTLLGDPIEIEALTQAFAPCAAASCAIGSVKTNIGHLDAAAGIAGFIKAVLAVQTGHIPPSLHFQRPNPQIDFAAGPFYVNTAKTPWDAGEYPRRAGISSFGIGGTNAHVIVEQYQSQTAIPQPRHDASSPPYAILPLSAHSESALEQIQKNLARRLTSDPGLDLHHVAFTLQTGRKPLRLRQTIVCSSLEEAVLSLDAPGAPILASGDPPAVAFMFPGQGAQCQGMGRDLYLHEPRFRRDMDRCLGILNRLGLDLDLESSAVNDTAAAQPLLFAVEYSLAQLLISWGVRPFAMTGHSLGEFVAACLAGVFTLEEGLRLVTVRGRLMSAMPRGSMLGVSAPEEEVVAVLSQEPTLSLAAVNSPQRVVVSGPDDAINRFQQILERQEIPCRRLHTSHAFHSAMMDPAVDAFVREVATVELQPPHIPYISNLSGQWITREEAMDPAYWGRHLRNTVRFQPGIALLLERQPLVCLELGPGTTLKTFVSQHPAQTPLHDVLTTMPHPREKESGHRYLLRTVGRLWQLGVPIHWASTHAAGSGRRVPLPTYPFANTRYWIGLDQPLSAAWKPGDAESLSWRLTADQPQEPVPNNRRSDFAPPATATQSALAAIWQTFLGRPTIGIHDDFFQLGGDSLKATALAAKIQKEMKVPVPLQTLFDHPSIEELARYIDNQTAGLRFDPLPAAEKRDYYPLTPAQERLFILHRWNPASTAYNLPAVISLEGKLDETRLAAVFQTLIQRHESLRTAFLLAHGRPAQRVIPSCTITIESFEVNEEHAHDTIRSFVRPFDLSVPPLLRVGLARLAESRHLLLVDMHHIVSDGASISILQREFFALYKQASLPPLDRHYNDYAVWLAGVVGEESIQAQERFWLDRFSGSIPVLDLPLDVTRPTSRDFTGRTLVCAIGENETKALTELAAAHKATLYMTMLALVDILLWKVSGQDDIVVGSPCSGRRHPDAAPLIGMFVNTLALRCAPLETPAFGPFLDRVRQDTLDAFANQDYPFDRLVQKLEVRRDASRNPLFDVMFSWQNPQGVGEELADLSVKPYSPPHETVLFDLVFQAVHLQDHIHLNLSYATALFKEETAHRLVSYLQAIIAAVIRQPDIPLQAIDILPPRDKDLILNSFNAPPANVPVAATIHELFNRRAAQTPHAAAVVRSHRHITYGELARRSGLLAAQLSERGVRAGDIVPVEAEPGLFLVEALLAVLQAGAAYLPLDPADPPEKKQYQIADCAAGFTLREDNAFYTSTGDSPNAVTASPDDPAYVIYTSGSSGRPKGVLVRHRNAVNAILWYAAAYGLESGARHLLLSNITFDPSVLQVFGCLTAGATLFMESRSTLMDGAAFRSMVARYGIHIIHFIPNALAFLLAGFDKLPSVRVVISGGERLDDGLKDNLLSNGYELYNHYGPTETAIVSLRHCCGPGPVTLGTPLSNTRCYIMNPESRLQPIGVWGELWIGGAGVAAGYLNRPELTAQRFVQDPFVYGEKIYKTGDRVRFLPDGSIEFSGRLDRQVKLRGFRIEPGEIEARLLGVPAIAAAAVVMKKGGRSDACLVAYVSANREGAVDPAAIKRELAVHLPGHMIPAYIIPMDSLPLTTSGKIDRRMLEALPLESAAGHEASPPGTPTERAVAAIWKDTLASAPLSVQMNFFDAGGNSLNIIQVHQALQSAFGGDIPVAALFEHTTIRSLARYLDNRQSPDPAPLPADRSTAIHEGRARLARRLNRNGGGNQ